MGLRNKLIKALGGYSKAEYISLESSKDLWETRAKNSLEEKANLSRARNLASTLSDKLDDQVTINRAYAIQIEDLKEKLNGK
tara:strand:- start:941 stop:1186 length:246 start_codon:yes stop_codon:yes gene_type:complete